LSSESGESRCGSIGGIWKGVGSEMGLESRRSARAVWSASRAPNSGAVRRASTGGAVVRIATVTVLLAPTPSQ
jgi:hypothetical protein